MESPVKSSVVFPQPALRHDWSETFQKLIRHPQHTWAGLVEEWPTIGATYVGVNTMNLTRLSLSDRLAAIQHFKEETGV